MSNADQASLTTFVMTGPVPWPDDPHAADAFGKFDAASLYEDGVARPCAIRRIASEGAVLRLDPPVRGDADIAVELATGQRAAAKVEWTRAGEAGVRFARPIDMVALLNRTLVGQVSERRRMPRVELRCHVGMKWSGELATATLRNISASGLQVEGADLPPRDTFVDLFIDGLNLPAGVVVWQQGGLAGIELMEEVAWSSLMPWIRAQAPKASERER
jgi:hypothetical protein